MQTAKSMTSFSSAYSMHYSLSFTPVKGLVAKISHLYYLAPLFSVKK